METIKFSAPAVVEMLKKSSPRFQKSRFSPGEKLRAGQRGIGEPAAIRREAHQKTGIHKQPRQEEDPVAERVQAREGHIARAGHERDQEVAKPKQDRGGKEEDHGRAVHGEELVVDFRAEQVVLRQGQLRAHKERLNARQAEEQEGREHIPDPDHLMVDRAEHALQVVF